MQNKEIIYNKENDCTMESFIRGYKVFLDSAKTERETISVAVDMAIAAGFVDMDSVDQLKPGDRAFKVIMKKSMVLFKVGEANGETGLNILGAHVDSTRIDLKAKPLYEDSGFAYFDTHYYGFIKKYQWLTIPLAIHGVVISSDGLVHDVVIGESEEDPVFAITDLLPHLQVGLPEKNASEVPDGEKLDLLIGNKAILGEEKDNLVAGISELIKSEYGIAVEDFKSAELEIVPAGRARDCGFDRNLVMAYGHDDRVAAYAAISAICDEGIPTRTSCCILTDKEEIGSVGATGMQSAFFENAVAELLDKTCGFSELKLRRILAESQALSLDVTSAYDPLYPEAYDKHSAGFAGKGFALKKYCGVKGKNSSNDANAEYMGRMLRLFDKCGVRYQLPEMGKVDVGGGGTITHLLSRYGMDAVDGGVAVLCMHAPWEICSKTDIYEEYRAVRAFLFME